MADGSLLDVSGKVVLEPAGSVLGGEVSVDRLGDIGERIELGGDRTAAKQWRMPMM
ncbi:hypothetical protein [Nocardia sp. NPDC049707]|uniref:hypothetical protein n=1 Tax=Nocardia sp. NPDC049707 TaxID=3154735 RepID=UPI00341DAA06